MPFQNNERRMRLYRILNSLMFLYFERRQVAADARRARQVEDEIRKLRGTVQPITTAIQSVRV
jgi:hypothetical protein